jgi:hypothetical protein
MLNYSQRIETSMSGFTIMMEDIPIWKGEESEEQNESVL